MYTIDSLYPRMFHREYAPSWLVSILIGLGHLPPRLTNARFVEIGCGQGFMLAHLAAANPDIEFHGIDLSPLHVRAARATASGLKNIRFTCADIAELEPEPAEFVICHGVYSWVSDQTRAKIRRFAAESLVPGGLVALHYMTAPGSSAFQAFHAIFRACRSMVDPVASGLKHLTAMREAKSGFFRLHPHAAYTLDRLLAENRDYITHDYLNPHFAALEVGDVMTDMAAEGLERVGSAAGIENIDAVSLPKRCAQLVAVEDCSVLRETLKDLARNQACRYDIYMHPAAPLSAGQHTDLLRLQRFAILPGAPAPGGVTFNTRIGPVDGDAAIFGPLLSQLKAGPVRFVDLEKIAPFSGYPGLLNQALQMLQWSGAIHPMRGDLEPRATAHLDLVIDLGLGTALFLDSVARFR